MPEFNIPNPSRIDEILICELFKSDEHAEIEVDEAFDIYTNKAHKKEGYSIAVNKKSLFREMIYAVEGFWRSNCEEEEEKLSIKGNQENL